MAVHRAAVALRQTGAEARGAGPKLAWAGSRLGRASSVSGAVMRTVVGRERRLCVQTVCEI